MLSDPVVIALLARAGGTVTLSGHEIDVASEARIEGTRNPRNGDVHLRLIY